ncbi:MAG: hypothetical protein ACRDGA_13420, partial [Bacteroidota bacterium]
MDSKLAIGVDLGATTVKTGVVLADGRLLYQTKLPSHGEQGPAAVVKQIEASVRDALQHANGQTVEG